MYIYGEYYDDEIGTPTPQGPVIPHSFTDSNSLAIRNLTIEMPAVVTPKAVQIEPQIKDYIRSIIPSGCILEGGPYGNLKLRTPWHADEYFASVYGTMAAVPAHMDEAGITIGVVLINEGGQELVVNNRSWLLEEGALFHINSDLAHETRSRKPGLLAFATIDFGWRNSRIPNVTYKDIADEILQSIALSSKREKSH